jgi:hypothetical protein
VFRVDAVQRRHRHGHAVPQQAGRLAQRHRVEAGQQGAEEGGGPAARGGDALLERVGELAGPVAEPGQRERLPAGHLDGHDVVLGRDVLDEGEADPLTAGRPDDQQRVVIELQFRLLAVAQPAEAVGLADHGRVLRGEGGLVIAELGEHLGAHRAHPGQLHDGALGQRYPQRELLALGHRCDLAERDAQDVTGRRCQHEGAADHDLPAALLGRLA